MAIKQNRDKHVELFERSLIAYRAEAVKYLDESLELARSGKRIRREIKLIEPMNHVKDYDQVVAMLEMTSDKIIVIDSREFAMFVMDDWGWSSQFDLTNQSYGVS